MYLEQVWKLLGIFLKRGHKWSPWDVSVAAKSHSLEFERNTKRMWGLLHLPNTWLIHHDVGDTLPSSLSAPYYLYVSPFPLLLWSGPKKKTKCFLLRAELSVSAWVITQIQDSVCSGSHSHRGCVSKVLSYEHLCACVKWSNDSGIKGPGQLWVVLRFN